MLSTDSQIFHEGSAVRSRILEYGGLAEELHVVVYTNQKAEIRNQKLGKNIFAYPTNTRTKWLYFFDAYKIGKKIIHDSKFMIHDSVITSQDPFETGLVGALLAKYFKIPLQIQAHTDFLSPYFTRASLKNWIRAKFGLQMIKKADGIRVVSDRIKKSLIKKGISEEKIAVLPIFVDVQEIKNKTAQAESQWSNSRPTIITVARLAPEKNLGLAIEAVGEVVKKYPNLRYAIVGAGPEQNWLHEQIERLGITKNVELKGASDPDGLFKYYKSARDSGGVFLLTSDYEGYGLAPIEAAAAGLPVAMTDVGVAIGSVVPVGDKNRLIEVLNELLSDKNKRNQLVVEQNRMFENWPTEADYLNKMKELWQSCYLSHKK